MNAANTCNDPDREAALAASVSEMSFEAIVERIATLEDALHSFKEASWKVNEEMKRAKGFVEQAFVSLRAEDSTAAYAAMAQAFASFTLVGHAMGKTGK